MALGGPARLRLITGTLFTESQFNEFEENWECNVGKIVPGVGNFRNPPVRLKAGDKVVVEIEKVGRLENHCVAGSGETRIA